jgi:hypothetical protein
MEQRDCIAVLKDYASAKKKRITACQLYDANVSRSVIDQSTGWVPQLVSGHVLTHQIHMTFRRRRIHLIASEEYISLAVHGALEIGQCSINCVNRVSDVDQPSDLRIDGQSRWSVFLPRNRQPHEALINFLNLPALLSAVELVIQSPKDSLHVYIDALCVYFQPTSSGHVQKAIELLSGLVGIKTRAKKENLDSLPKEFAPLIPLIQKWSEGDDSLREEMLNRASKSTLKKLIEAVSPFLPQINDYLDRNDDETACALGTLAEVSIEAEHELKNR